MRARPHAGMDPTTRSLDPLDTLPILGHIREVLADTLVIEVPEDPVRRATLPEGFEVETGVVLVGVSVRVGRGARATAARAGTRRGTRPRFPCFMFATCSTKTIALEVIVQRCNTQKCFNMVGPDSNHHLCRTGVKSVAKNDTKKTQKFKFGWLVP